MQVFIGRNGTAKTEDEFERRLYILQVDLARSISAAPRHGRLLPGLAVVPHRNLQGHVLADQLGKYYPDLHEEEERAGAGASALLDQHVPDLVAGTSLPDDRP